MTIRKGQLERRREPRRLLWIAAFAPLALLGCRDQRDEGIRSDRHETEDQAEARARQEAAQKQDQKAREDAAEANAKAREQNTQLMKERADYSVKIQKDLDSVDKSVDELKAKEATASANAKTQVNQRLKDVDTRRSAVVDELKKIDKTTDSNWDDYKTRVDQQVADLKKAVDRAKDVKM